MCIHLKVQSFENILLRLWLLKLQYLYLFMVYIEFFYDLHLLPSNPNLFLIFLAHLPQLGSSGLQCSSPNHRFVYSCRRVPLVKEKQLKLCEIFYSHEIIPLRQLPIYSYQLIGGIRKNIIIWPICGRLIIGLVCLLMYWLCCTIQGNTWILWMIWCINWKREAIPTINIFWTYKVFLHALNTDIEYEIAFSTSSSQAPE